MKEQLISFETAKLAKEKGFSERVRFIWYDNKMKPFIEDNLIREYGYIPGEWNGNMHYKKDPSETYTSAPTQSLLQKWLREEHNIHILTRPFHDSLLGKTTCIADVIRIGDGRVLKSPRMDTYEEALEIALQNALMLI